MNLSKRTKLIRVANSAVAAQTAQNSSIVDTSGYRGALFFVAFGDVTDTSVLGLAIEQNIINSATGMTALPTAAATFTAGATSADSKILSVDVAQPRERYLRAVVTRTVANAVIDGVFCLLYDEAFAPPTADASVIASACIASPSE